MGEVCQSFEGQIGFWVRPNVVNDLIDALEVMVHGLVGLCEFLF
jgi:hypothetical protein